MYNKINRSFGGKEEKTWEDEAIDMIGQRENSMKSKPITPIAGDTSGVPSVSHALTKESVFRDKGSGGGSKKLQLNRKVWDMWEYTTKNKAEIARELGISRSSVYHHLFDYGKM